MTFIKPFCHFFNLDEGRNESIRKKEYENSSKPLLNFRFPVQEDLYLSSKLENSPISRQSINDAIIDMNRLNEKKMNCAAGGEVGSIFDLLANNPLLASRSIDGQTLNSDEQRQRQDKLREQLLNASKSSMPFDTFHKNNSRMDIAADLPNEECEKLSPVSSDPGRLSKNVMNNGTQSPSVTSSVQAALNALQAGQISLNQVIRIPMNFMLLSSSVIDYKVTRGQS